MHSENLELVRCECEEPGAFNSGVPGILAAMDDGHLAAGAVVERCDLCRRFASDAEARARLVELWLADEAPELVPFTVRCYAIVRVTFPGILAVDEVEAVRRVKDRFDWDVHGLHGEFTDEFARVVPIADSGVGRY